MIGNIATAGEVTDCYAWGNVSTVDASSVGGAFGGVAASSVITNVYSIGAVTGTGGAGDIGGLSG
ncbi:MAG: hypothetical protein GWN30_18475, partial [Gammaproteobacteria bacterium]|nr:hypothetical protein [Gammaproteobacteria bacterium]